MWYKYEIALDSGVKINLDCLFQYHTYSGLYEGLPTHNFNQELIQKALSYTNEKLWCHDTPYLIPPVERPVESASSHKYIGFGLAEPVMIPAITCMASFNSPIRVQDSDADCSSISLVWHQNSFALPIDEDILRKIRVLNYQAIATDHYL